MAQGDKEDHISEHALEEYSRGTLSEEETESLEEHLLVCPDCQDRLAETDEFVGAMRDAAARLQMEPPSALEEHWRAAWRWLWRPVPVMAACGAAMVLLMAGTVWHRGGPAAGGAATVVLEAMRGDATSAASAPAGKALVLELNAVGLPAPSTYRLEVVDERGAVLFENAVRLEAETIAAPLPRRLEPGRYWVRLSEPEAGGSLLREFGFTVH
ncbi:MAG TPA: zf-HC2 domain-containing protein [Bryobacteraceae bacterium]|nr:zf-HC2 domain-containing protein [Bryobacteraceae bacterium]HOL71111.1 zf-HC2 domain-containing protein [Bryobacteraceae bacterium]HOQ47165.1 zf-HC2 domain-containing protein [Bryobacteraceae bacterium]HPQ14900.1 zf-HC2 domain-containing protein [Bryobacteraceae bacterium]HPU72532.1 zf-HC2 domain-containing protein [Bryobacteraceae bacterium]